MPPLIDTNLDAGDDAFEGLVPLDHHAIEADIVLGARAYQKLLNHAADDWASWSAVVLGFRGLRSLAFEKSGTSDIASWHYRQSLSYLMTLKKYAIYDQIGKQTRSTMYKLMDSIDELNDWYAGLPAQEKLRWKHPDAIAKHAPKHLVQGGKGGNQLKPKVPPKAKKPLVNAEIERLRQILLIVIQRLAAYEPDAMKLLDEVMPRAAADPDDGLPEELGEEL